MPSRTSLSISALARVPARIVGVARGGDRQGDLGGAHDLLLGIGGLLGDEHGQRDAADRERGQPPATRPARQGRRTADQAAERPRRASDAARPARHSANSAPVAAMRHGKPDVADDQQRQQAAQEDGAPGRFGLRLRAVRFDKVSPGRREQVGDQRQQEHPAHQRRTRPAAAGTRCARSSRFPAASPRPGTAASRSPRRRRRRRPADAARSRGRWPAT